MRKGGRWSYRHLALLLVGAALVLPSCSSRSGLVGSPAPDFSLPSLEGRDVSLADYKGKVVVMSLFAHW